MNCWLKKKNIRYYKLFDFQGSLLSNCEYVSKNENLLKK